MDVRVDKRGIHAIASGAEAVKAGASVLSAYIHSQTVLKVGLYLLAGFFLVGAAVLVVFAPAGREGVTTIIAIALFAVAVGCAGFSTFGIKAPGFSANATDGPDSPNAPDAPRSIRSRRRPGAQC
jgi:hypothetical protein